MIDPRATLEAYAKEQQHAYAGHRRDFSAPRAFEALRAVMELHAPRMADAYDYGHRRNVRVQQCAECADQCHSRSGLGCDSPDAPWPCATVRAVSTALTGGGTDE